MSEDCAKAGRRVIMKRNVSNIFFILKSTHVEL